MKKYTAFILALIMAFSLCGCGNSKSLFPESTGDEKQETTGDSSDLKVGFLFSSDGDAPDTVSRVEGIRKMQEETGLSDSQVVIEESVKKADCESKVAELVEEGCSLIFSTDTSFESAIVESATKYPEVQFCQEGGKKAKKSGLSNLHSYYTRIYEAYYVGGLVAGIKMNAMLDKGDLSAEECVIGFVASEESARTASCIDAFYLGVERVCSQSTVLVRYVEKSGVYDSDGEAARQLVAAGVKMMAQYAFTTAVAAVCAENDIPLVGNDVNLISTAPKEALTSALSDWSVYYSYAVKRVMKGKEIKTDWTGGYAEGANVISQLNDEHVADGTAEKVAELEKSLRSGKTKVFDVEKFTIEGSSLTTLIETDSSYKKYKKHIKNGAFMESVKKSAPIFDKLIDGITVSTYDYLAEQDTSSEEETTTEQ